MPSTRSADILFLLDASASMKPCFDAMCQHVGSFVDALNSGQFRIDSRVDFLAHRASDGDSPGDIVMQCFSVHSDNCFNELYWHSQPNRFFTTDLELFRRRLASIEVQADEAQLLALDFALDFPWRDAASCHRIVVMLTDEAFETGVWSGPQLKGLPELQRKIMDLRVALTIVGPPSHVFEQLSEVDRSDYQEVQSLNDGLRSIDFGKLLERIGRSISVSVQRGQQGMDAPKSAPRRSIYGQASWRPDGLPTRLTDD